MATKPDRKRAVTSAPISATRRGAALSDDDAAEIARDAYIYAFSLVLMEITRRVMTNVGATTPTGSAPMNQFSHIRAFPDPSFTQVVRPNADTLYSTLYFDVAGEPLVISVPDSGGRYFLLPALDLWTDVFTSPGARTTGTGAQEFAIVGPDWHGELPTGVRAVRCPTSVGWMIGRTQTNGAADYDKVHAFQDGLRTVPLHEYGHDFTWPEATVNSDWDGATPPVEQVTGMDASTYYTLFADVVKTNRPHAHDYPMLDRLQRVGMDLSRPFVFDALTPQAQNALRDAMPTALSQVKAALLRSGVSQKGWKTNVSGIGTYGTNYLTRAAVAYGGLGANVPEDAVYPTSVTDADGKPFSSDAKYVLHFDKAQIPPVRAFWSLTMYNEKQLFAENEIKRYAIGDRDELVANADGSLDIYIQRESPGAAKEANWLPAPASGSMSMNLRLYWPRAEILLGDWMPPAVRRVS